MGEETNLGYRNRCYVCGDSRFVLTCKVCKSRTRLNSYSYSYKGRQVRGFANYCPTCRAFIINYERYSSDIEHWEVLNSVNSIHRLSAEYKRVVENRENAYNKQQLTEAGRMLAAQKKNRTIEKKKETKKAKTIMAPNQVKVPYIATKPNESRLKKREHDIDAQDFIVRSFSSVFRCRNKGHAIKDIRATFKTITRKGTVNIIEIPAGYCPQCNIYFILESTYRRIKQSGVPICRMLDENKYFMNGSYTSAKDTDLAQESVLMQFGYTVNQVDDLPVIQRRAILAAIVDYRVLTKNEVISYLDYFIRYRKNQKNQDGSLKYGIAIDKWKDDREFISKYKIGAYTEVAMKRIIANGD